MHSYAAGFRRVGAEVETYCVARAYRRGLGRTPSRVAGRVAPNAMIERFNRRVLEDLSARRPHLVLVLKGQQLAPQTILELRQRTGGVWVNYYPDDPFSPERANRLTFGPAALRAYDHCLTFAGDLVDRYRAAGISKVDWLPFARDPDQHFPVPPVEPPEFEVMFAGNLDAERVRWLEPVARSFRLAILADQRRAARGSTLRLATFEAPAFGEALPRALARAAISLNVMREQNRLNHNMRSYESPACGAFTLSQRTPELERLFREDEEIAFVESPAEIVERIRYWLDRPADRRRIAAGGFRRVESDTYDERARSILETAGIVPHAGVA
ncbi:MAG TPA: glycosyltransferase [Gemmatimonadaceae bacterium]